MSPFCRDAQKNTPDITLKFHMEDAMGEGIMTW